jgi:sterol desaturase/sphingolipid hydroxylase (fatty acid hydroxylase superfamily)
VHPEEPFDQHFAERSFDARKLVFQIAIVIVGLSASVAVAALLAVVTLIGWDIMMDSRGAVRPLVQMVGGAGIIAFAALFAGGLLAAITE